MPELYSFEDNNHFFIKFFLLDASLNLNMWGVTENSMKANLDTFIGKPFVMTPTFGHPEARNGDELLEAQEKFRVGTIIEVGFDTAHHKAFGVAEITDRTAIETIKDGFVNFVSPSIVFNHEDAKHQLDGFSVVDNWEGAHVAGVKDPAFGMFKAQIKGKCAGDKVTCEKELRMVQASKEAQTIRTFKIGDKYFKIAASECVENCIRRKAERDIMIDDQAIAICFSECGESSKSGISPQGKKPYGAQKTKEKNWLGFPKDQAIDTGNIDSHSLEQITVVDLGLPKKKKGVNEPGKPNKKCNIDPNLPCVDTNEGSIKQKRAKAKTMTAQDEEKKDEEENAQDEEEKKKEEEGNFEDEEKKKEMDAQDEEEKKEDEEAEDDEDKEDEHKDARALRKEVHALKIQMRRARLDPVVKSIIDAKIKLGFIKDAEAVRATHDLTKLPERILLSMQADYKSMSDRSSGPKYPYEVLQASRLNRGQHTGADLDNLLEAMKR